jgi:MYXO-CTERM domain-containing protein
VEPIDLFEVAGGSVAKRLAPVAALVALVLFILWRRRRH